MKKIGIFGGSFSPVHSEHIKIAKGAIAELGLDELFIIPTFISPHKISSKMPSGEHRYNMLKLAFNGVKKVTVSDYEISKGEVSYTYLTVAHFKRLYNDSTLYLIMGSDMLENFPTWKNPEFIVKNANLVLISRGGDGELNAPAIAKINELYNSAVILLNTFGEEVSSTEVRLRLKLSLPVEGLISAEVENYINSHNLYKKDKYYNYVVNALPEKRRVHTLGVILTAKKLAKKLNESEEFAELASLLHDVAKYEDINNYLAVLPKNCPESVAHQFIGAHLAKAKLGVENECVLNAIKYHTTGRANMSTLERIVYVADLIEPFRGYKMVDYLRNVVKTLPFDEAFKICVKEVIEFLKSNGQEIYYLTEESYLSLV